MSSNWDFWWRSVHSCLIIVWIKSTLVVWYVANLFWKVLAGGWFCNLVGVNFRKRTTCATPVGVLCMNPLSRPKNKYYLQCSKVQTWDIDKITRFLWNEAIVLLLESFLLWGIFFCLLLLHLNLKWSLKTRLFKLYLRSNIITIKEWSPIDFRIAFLECI